MALKYKHKLLFVDDEEAITKALYRLFRKEGYEIHTASSGQEGLEALKEDKRPFSLIISDQKMPAMTGSQFLEKAKQIFPESIRILLTGYSDMDAIVDGINKGEIHRYITKPWNDDDLLIQIMQSLEQYELRIENKRLLALTARKNKELKELNEHLEEKVAERSREIIEKNKKLARLNKELESNLYNTVKAFGSLVEMQHPSLAAHGRRVSILARGMAKLFEFSEEEIIQTEIAGMLHDIGKLGFPKELLEYEKDKWSAEEKELYCKHPILGQDIVRFINNLDHVGLLIRCHHEQYDGNGYPAGLSEEEIPLGARIISVADAYDTIVSLNVDPGGSLREKIMEIKKEKGHFSEVEILQEAAIIHLKEFSFVKYDPDVIKVFLDLIKSSGGTYGKEVGHSIEDLREGMVLARDIYSSRGRFLLPSNTALTARYISKLQALHEQDPITDTIYVLRNDMGEEDKER